MVSKSQYTPTQSKLCWLTDLHLDRTAPDERSALFRKLRNDDYDQAIITGDIATAETLCDELAQLADACGKKPLYYTLGNHDFYGSDLEQVYGRMRRLCDKIPNLHHLQDAGVVRLNQTTALVGHHGWADARAGWGRKTVIKSPDHVSIDDFSRLSQSECYDRMEGLGNESTKLIRRLLVPTLARYQHVVVATHVPPFPSCTQYDDRRCGKTHLPHYCNVSMGAMLIALAKRHSHRRITVIAGHTHSACKANIIKNLRCIVGGVIPRKPQIQETLIV